MSTTEKGPRWAWGQANARKELAEVAEREAQAALERAKREREAAEKNLPGLERAVEAAVKHDQASIHGGLKLAEQHLAQGRALEKTSGQARPDLEGRQLARSFLYAPGERPVELLERLATHDPIAGSFYEAVRSTSALIAQIAERGLGSELHDQVDDVNCAGWRAFTSRARWLAGEVEP